jgi:hypothetical protein
VPQVERREEKLRCGDANEQGDCQGVHPDYLKRCRARDQPIDAHLTTVTGALTVSFSF